MIKRTIEEIQKEKDLKHYLKLKESIKNIHLNEYLEGYHRGTVSFEDGTSMPFGFTLEAQFNSDDRELIQGILLKKLKKFFGSKKIKLVKIF